MDHRKTEIYFYKRKVSKNSFEEFVIIRKFSVESIEVKLSSRKNMSSSDVKLAESEKAILKRLGDRKTLILLDEREAI